MLMVLRWEYEQEAARQQRFGRSHFAQHHFGGDMENVKRCCFKLTYRLGASLTFVLNTHYVTVNGQVVWQLIR